MKVPLSTSLVAIGVLVLYIIYLQQCKSCPPIVGKPVTVQVDTQKIIARYTSGWTKPKPDTIWKTKVRWKETSGESPQPVFVETIKEVPTYITTPVDTQAILEDYYATIVYKDSTVTPAGDIIRVTDNISQNRIQARQWSTSIAHLQITKTMRLPWMIYWGGGVYTSKTELLHAAEIDLGYRSRKQQDLELSVLYNKEWRYGVKFHTALFTFK